RGGAGERTRLAPKLKHRNAATQIRPSLTWRSVRHSFNGTAWVSISSTVLKTSRTRADTRLLRGLETNMRMDFGVRLSLALPLLIACAWGQESRGIISGTVTDPQGSVVPAATVDVKNLETNVVTKASSNERGLYTTPPINPGQYSVTVSASGF